MKKTNSKNKQNTVRIISGSLRRSNIPIVNVEGLRPTPDRVRETIFNWLEHLFSGNWKNIRCLDLFAGTGVLGFEALSRGAQSALLVESNKKAYLNIIATKNKFQIKEANILLGDAFTTAKKLIKTSKKFDLIFLDPPYSEYFLPKSLPLFKDLLSEKGILYAESPYSFEMDSYFLRDFSLNWSILRSGNAGLVHYYLLKKFDID